MSERHEHRAVELHGWFPRCAVCAAVLLPRGEWARGEWAEVDDADRARFLTALREEEAR